MSLPPPPPPLNTTTAPLPQTTTTAPPPLPLTSGTAPSPVPIITAEEPLPILSPEAISGTLRELVQAVRGISLYLAGTQPPPPSVAPTTYGPPSLPWATPAFQPLHGGAPLQHYHAAGTPWPVWPPSRPLGLPHQSLPATTAQAPAPHQQPPPPSTAAPPAPRTTGRPLHQVQFPSSPSPIPAWAAGSSSGPIYTPAPEHPAPSLPFERSSSSAPYGPEFPDPAYARPPTSAAPGHGGPTSPRFAKLNFTTYDGAEDPLNWLNQCEQFFRGQRTLASDRTWLASYHLRGTAQTWYYALGGAGGMPWDRFMSSPSLVWPPHPWQPTGSPRPLNGPGLRRPIPSPGMPRARHIRDFDALTMTFWRLGRQIGLGLLLLLLLLFMSFLS
ncbi:hypothetical protein ZWY2020_024531 [Hordeum vulgare]|nr:hypothetical protein ZWY2020_024531 [Hordeum vulgare]